MCNILFSWTTLFANLCSWKFLLNATRLKVPNWSQTESKLTVPRPSDLWGTAGKPGIDLLSNFYTCNATSSPHFSNKSHWPTKLRGNSRETLELTIHSANCYVSCNSKSLCQWWQAWTKRHVCSSAHVSFKAFLSKINQIHFSVWIQKQHTDIIKSEFQLDMSHCQTHYS